MKMAESIPESLFASCGMNCLVCYVYLRAKKPCGGCLSESPGKPAHCRTCAIAGCTKEKGHQYCFECIDFPCGKIKNLNKSYVKRYGVSLIENSLAAKKSGIVVFLASEREKWMCHCNGIISLHDGYCSECRKTVEVT
jgi:hypothetical protein